MIDEIRRANAHRAIIDLGDDNPEIVAALKPIRDGCGPVKVDGFLVRMEALAIAGDWDGVSKVARMLAVEQVADEIADGKYGVVVWTDGDGDRLTSIRTIVNGRTHE